MRLTRILYVAIVSLVGVVLTKAAASSNNLCQNVWKFPPNCLGNCTYQLVWRFKPQDDSIEFIVSSKHAQRWTGVGFAADKTLINSDAIFAWIEDNSRYVMMDAYLPTYSNPISDKLQSISNISATVSNGLISFRFTRKRNTGDPLEDLIFGDDKCPYLVYPVEGGSVDVKNRIVSTSEHEPHVSETPVCIRACNYKATTISTTTTTTTPPPPQPTTTATVTKRPPTTTTTSTTTSTSTTTTRRPTTTTTTSTTTTTTTAKPPATTTSRPSTTTSTTTTSTTTQRPPTTSTPAPPTTTTPAPASSSTTSTLASAEQTQQSQSDQQWCVGRWSHPPDCRFQVGPATVDTLAYLKQPVDESTNIKPLPLELSDCSYMAQWQYLEQSDSVEFIIQTKTRNRWTGIGFSNSTRMANSDAIIGLIEELSGRHFIMDTWLRDHVMPEIDQHQNTESTWGKRENGTTTVRFRRRRVTGDQFDFQFTDDSCAYFFFPTQGGSFNAISKRMHKHESVPSVSKQRICIKSCTRPVTASSNDIKLKVAAADKAEATQATLAATSQAAESSSSSVASNNNSVGQSSSAPTTTTTTSVDQAATTAATAAGGQQQQDDKSNFNLSPSNDLGADIDSSSSTSSASSGQASSSIQPQQNNASSFGHKLNSSADSNPFSKLSFLTEPSLRWLAGIGCVATLLAMIVFQACFTVYKNKQAYKQNLYRQSALKQNAASYLHGAYIADGASAVSSSAGGGGADLHHHSSHPSSNSMGLNSSGPDHQSVHHSHSHQQHPHHHQSHAHSHPFQPHGQRSHLPMNAAGADLGVGGHHATRASNGHPLGLRRAEASVVPEEDQLEEVEEDEMEELEEVEEELEEMAEDEEDLEEELEDFEYDESSFYYSHPQLQQQQQQQQQQHLHHQQQQHHHHHASRAHQPMLMGTPSASNHSGHSRHTHQQLRMQPQQFAHAHPPRNNPYQAQAHQQHYHHHSQPVQHRHQQPVSHHRHRQSARNPYHMQQQMGGHLPSRPDSYFLPSQRRY